MWKQVLSSPQIPLRAGLAFTYLYSGLGLVTKPENWYGFAPTWFVDLVENFISINTFLRVQGVAELILGILLLSWFLKPKFIFIVAILGTLQILSIIIFAGIDLITFRDIGLLGAWLALMSIYSTLYKNTKES